VVYLGITLIGLGRYPAVWGDEAWIAEPAWVMAAGGPLGSPSCGELFRFADRLYWMPPLHFLALAGVYTAGIPVLLGGRLLSALLGAATLIVLLRWTRSVLAEPGTSTRGSSDASGDDGARRTWILVAVALAFAADPMLWKSHRTIRFEAMLALWSVLAVSVAWKRDRAWRGALTGAACALAMLTHPNGALTVVAAGGVLLLRRRSWSAAWRDAAAAAGVFAVLCLPTAIYFLQDRAADFANVIGQNAPHLHGERSSPVWNQWGRELHRYAAYFAWPRLALPLLLWAGTLVAAIRLRAPAALGWVIGVTLAGLACMPNKSELYLTLAAPYLFVLAAWVGMRLRPRLAAVLAALWLANLLAADAALLRRNRHCDYDAWTRPLSEAVPERASVAGTFLDLFPFREHRFYSVSRVRAGDLFDAQPAYLIWSKELTEAPQFARLRRELGPFLNAHADVVLRVDSPCYGSAVLYRPRWDEGTEAAAGWERFGLDVSPTENDRRAR
jgi:hypothetical protein